MFLEIVSPEATLFGQEVTAVSVPGINGEFQMLNNHAAIVSVLGKGAVKIQGDALEIAEEFQANFQKEGKNYSIAINSGTVEMKENKVVVLVD
jgi:F-type H+-transporting ATPase subunit epsilon|tara:strand:+ start:50217 stop:50495 length:279 start_codon:yes stop_codon:yes gene_type:complete